MHSIFETKYAVQITKGIYIQVSSFSLWHTLCKRKLIDQMLEYEIILFEVVGASDRKDEMSCRMKL